MRNSEITRIGFELTNRCDLRCRICTIWKEKAKRDLTLDDVKNITECLNNLSSVVLTGGEPLLNPQINDIYKFLLMQKNISYINISTNAYSNKIMEFLDAHRDNLQKLSLNISIDGLNKLHNNQRGKKDAFNKTMRNILSINKGYSLPLTIKFVISSINYEDLFKVYLLSKKLNCGLKINILEYASNYYHRIHPVKGEIYNLSREQKQKVNKTLEKVRDREPLKSDLIPTIMHLQYLLEGSHSGFIRKNYIESGIYKSLFITSNKLIYNCIYSPPVGCLKNNKIKIDLSKINTRTNKHLTHNTPKYLSPYSYLRQI